MELNFSYQVTRFIYVCAIDSVIVNWKYIIIIIIIIKDNMHITGTQISLDIFCFNIFFLLNF